MDNKKLEERIRVLERENDNLKKKLTRYRKKASQLAFQDDAIFDDISIELGGKPKNPIICERCGNDEVREVKILKLTFHVCSNCKYKKKI